MLGSSGVFWKPIRVARTPSPNQPFGHIWPQSPVSNSPAEESHCIDLEQS